MKKDDIGKSFHPKAWDDYVENWENYLPEDCDRLTLTFPGDEWFDEKEWERVTNEFLKPYLPKNRDGVVIELGQGSGKYTLKLVDYVSRIICFDVSEKFIQIAKKRLPKGSRAEISFELLKLEDCYEIRDAVGKQGLLGKVDLLFSIDSMVHVELHTLLAYFINAALCLKTGGHLVMTVATCTNEDGFSNLLRNMPWDYGGLRHSLQFYYVSKDILVYCLEKLGFEIVSFKESRDILFVARKGENSAKMIERCENIYRSVYEKMKKPS